MLRTCSFAIVAVLMLAMPAASDAQQPSTLSDNTRVMAIGDSITAGMGAVPVTGGYAYRLYEQGIYDAMTNTAFANAAVPGATSQQVLALQVPSATQIFFPHVIVMTVGGNDCCPSSESAIRSSAGTFQNNLTAILVHAQLPAFALRRQPVRIEGFPVPTDQIVDAFNQVVDGVAAFANAGVCGGRVKVADVHAAFDGSQQGLLMFNRPGAHPAEPHPTNAGHRAIAQAFIDVK
jgi:lysophospholipase L1-like esterase